MIIRLTLSATMLLAGLLAAPAQAQADSTWRDHNRAADAATARRDFADARRHLDAMNRLLGGHPAVAIALARNAVQRGDTAFAVRQFERIAAMGVTSRFIADTIFNVLRSRPDFQAAATAIAANGGTLGSA